MADVEAIGRLISLRAALGHPSARGVPPAAGHLVRSGRRARAEQGALGSRRDRIAIEKWMQEKQGIQQDLLGGCGGVCPAPVQAGIPDPKGLPASGPAPRRISSAPAPTADRSSRSSRAAPSATCAASRSAAELRGRGGCRAARLTARRGPSSHSRDARACDGCSRPAAPRSCFLKA